MAFGQQPGFKAVYDAFSELQKEGFHIPETQVASAAFIKKVGLRGDAPCPMGGASGQVLRPYSQAHSQAPSFTRRARSSLPRGGGERGGDTVAFLPLQAPEWMMGDRCCLCRQEFSRIKGYFRVSIHLQYTVHMRVLYVMACLLSAVAAPLPQLWQEYLHPVLQQACGLASLWHPGEDPSL